MNITNIDFSTYNENNPESLVDLGVQIYEALSTTGFMTVSNIGISAELRKEMFDLSKRFFSLPNEEKQKVGYRKASENFGFQGMGMEHLDPSKPADVKETFTMRDVAKYIDQADRWPSEDFKNQILYFYNEVFEAAKRLMRVFSTVLETEKEFFVDCHEGDNVTLRLLHYPPCDAENLTDEQLGAGAHTDYGMITLLFQDAVEGLEVCDKHGNWLPAPADPDKIVINTGDLMHRWTNDIFRSTPHRVKPQISGTTRYSIAMFIDPDADVMIETLSSCISDSRPNRYEPISAGDHILQKIEATQGIY